MRSRVPLLLVLTGALLAVVAVTGFVNTRPAPAPAAPAPSAATGLDRLIYDAQDALRREPGDAPKWALLGSAYVERARISADPSYYAKAQGALQTSMRISPDDNAAALIGLGQLANARHDFATAASFGERARALQPATSEVYGVLADAYTQLGKAAEATDAVQRMLDIRPGLAAFTRASYDLELHGRRDEARAALERALAAALSPDDAAFCRYYLGELAWNAGDVDGAAQQYDAGIGVAADNVALLQGKAKVAYAQGRVDEALSGYRAITTRVPLPQYVLEYAEMLDAAGRAGEAKAQYAVLAAQELLYTAQGSSDDQVGAIVAADHGDKAEALRRAEAEWGRRQSIFSADALAWALHVNGRDAEALTYVQRAAALGAPNATYSFHRGMILAGLGRGADARAALAEALAINPHFNPLQAPVARATITSLEPGS
jgi:tetratricopeptide (TPR) repeat protein